MVPGIINERAPSPHAAAGCVIITRVLPAESVRIIDLSVKEQSELSLKIMNHLSF